jgi:Domain of unknown function (DUF6431)
MVSVAGLGCKQYREQMDGGAVPELICPDPKCRTPLRGHGWYRRYLGGGRQLVRRVRCPRCKVSHAVLPEDVCAYRDLTFGAVEAGLAAGAPSAGAEVSRQMGRPGVRRVRGWLRSEQEPFAAKLLGLLGPVAGPWWRGAQEVVGQAAGWLTRLRHFTWSSFRYFLGGVSGLFRHGRPAARSPRVSP